MAFADPIALLRTYLTDSPTVDPVPIAGRVPDGRPDEFVWLRRIGGTASEVVREVARIDVFCWADTDPRAVELGNQVRTAVWALAGNNQLGVMVYEVAEFKTISSLDDPETDTPRTWATYDLTIRANEIIRFAP